ncbi:HAD-like protein [Lepidopterella palustris CBS 459.81]|uniref:HAD-like protein n=1 Tax=Lepidopterella palustris CBS 459.81 TaxID=1314670 RepID=A0A8E2J9Q2_9PEZI|nr:HAD-like protein [Lepidopterella palustris CBS 459.81]
MSNPPKALLFDIGGVCVISPFQAILDYELANAIPVGWINFSISRASPGGAWQRLERGECILNDGFFAQFKADLEVPSLWAEFWAKQPSSKTGPSAPPPVPQIDAKLLFWNMMRISRAPDPYMYPALHALRESGRFLLAALSNTVAFPDGIQDDRGTTFAAGLAFHPESPHVGDSRDISDRFDIFISSAHIGLRKPDARIYELAVRELDRESRRRGGDGVTAADVLFLDDIGANLKGARAVGMRTLKVELGRTEEAVRELERATGLKLLGEKARL